MKDIVGHFLLNVRGAGRVEGFIAQETAGEKTVLSNGKAKMPDDLLELPKGIVFSNQEGLKSPSSTVQFTVLGDQGPVVVMGAAKKTVQIVRSPVEAVIAHDTEPLG